MGSWLDGEWKWEWNWRRGLRAQEEELLNEVLQVIDGTQLQCEVQDKWEWGQGAKRVSKPVKHIAGYRGRRLELQERRKSSH